MNWIQWVAVIAIILFVLECILHIKKNARTVWYTYLDADTKKYAPKYCAYYILERWNNENPNDPVLYWETEEECKHECNYLNYGTI